MDRARNRLYVGPQFTNAFDTHMESLSPISFCSAFATADRRIFSTTRAAYLGVCLSMASARGTCCPRIISITGRAFRGATRTYRRMARASVIVKSCCCPLLERDSLFRLCLAVAFKEPGRSKFTKLVSNHILRHKDRNEFLPVVDCKRVANHVWDHGRSSRPRLDELAVLSLIHLLDLLEQMLIHECAFCH